MRRYIYFTWLNRDRTLKRKIFQDLKGESGVQRAFYLRLFPDGTFDQVIMLIGRLVSRGETK